MLNKIFNYLVSIYTQNKVEKGRRPELLNFPITENCNSRCVMCNVWKNNIESEMSPAEIANNLRRDYFSNLKHIGISGGEPTLRKDLVECVSAIVEVRPELRSLSITSHGFHFNRWSRFLPLIKAICDSKSIPFSLNISIDGSKDKHNFVRGTKLAYERALKTINIAKGLGIPVQIQCTLSNINVFDVNSVLHLAQNTGSDVIFRLAVPIDRLKNSDVIGGLQLSSEAASYLADFFESEALHNVTRSIGRGLYYEQISKALISGRASSRSMPCSFKNNGCLLTSRGSVYVCSVSDKVIADSASSSNLMSDTEVNVRKSVIEKDCNHCLHDQSGPWPVFKIFSYVFRRRFRKLPNLLDKGFKVTKLLALLTQVSLLKKSTRKNVISPSKIKSALVIGAYGGEHVGDAAILGGVILRSMKRYVRMHKVYVASFRPDRTKRWVDSLDLPLEIVVIDEKEISKYSDYDILIYGGGPLMELPLNLLLHLRTVYTAAKKNIPFSIEGAGLGPLKTTLSKHFVKQLLQISDYTRLRTDKAKRDALNDFSTEVELGTDPAFDYLYSRVSPSLYTNEEKAFLECNEINDRSKLVVAINLRPLWSKYSFGSGLDVEKIEENYLNELADSCGKLYQELKGNVSFVYFPMNADHYGMSDYIPCRTLENKLKPFGIELNIWYGEPGVDALICFLKKCDVVVSMRFHGCIFALSQNANNVIGIDYQIGKDGKVFDIMSDRNCGKNVIRVDKLNSQELYTMMSKISARNSIIAVKELAHEKE
ncbi:polysaccharide pyruvyl transferase family protein [Vibrio sp. JZG10]